MEEQLNLLNDIINLIKENITRISNIEYGEDYYIINHNLKEKERINFETKIKEDIELNQIDIALRKLNYSKEQSTNPDKLKSIKKVISIYLNKQALINNNRKFRIKEIESLKQKKQEIIQDEKYFYQTKQLVIDILNSFIYSINLNNTYYVMANLTNYNKLTAFVDNKQNIHPRVFEYFKELNPTIMYDACIYFETTLEALINLLTTNNIEWILITNHNFKKINQKKKNY